MAETELTIDHVGARGDGLALSEGKRIAVPFTLPGERLRAEVCGDHGECLELLAPSAARIAPLCAHFGICGGCALQHWHADHVAHWKQDRVKSALARVGIAAVVEPTLAAYGAGRRRVTLHIRNKDGVSRAGFMRAGSHALIDLDACPLLCPGLAEATDIAREIGHILRGLEKPLDVQLTAAIEGLDIDLRGAGRIDEGLRQKLVQWAMRRDLARLTLHGERLIEARAPGIALEGTSMRAAIPPGSFLQPTGAGEVLLAALAAAALKGAKHVAEAFCGLGPFGLRLARAMKVSAFDSDSAAIACFQHSIRANPGGKPCQAEQRDLFRRPLFAPELRAFDAVLLDPPRQGAEAQMREIAKSRLGRMAYIACDPISFARDARIACDAGFTLRRVTPVDQFRFSAHIELVAAFER